MGLRTVQRWLAAYAVDGPAGLIDSRHHRELDPLRGVDERWLNTCRTVLDEHVDASRPTKKLILERVEARLAEAYGGGVVPTPHRKRAHAAMAELTRGTNAFGGATKQKRSIARRPEGAYGRLRPTRPGEYLLLDTTPLDVFAMEPLTLRWVSVELVLDHGRIYLSAHVLSVCPAWASRSSQHAPTPQRTRLPSSGSSAPSARGCSRPCPATRGPDVYSRGDAVEDKAFYFLPELEQVIREWMATVYHRRPHHGLVDPAVPGLDLSPMDMYEHGVARAGRLRVPARKDLVSTPSGALCNATASRRHHRAGFASTSTKGGSAPNTSKSIEPSPTSRPSPA